MATIGKHNGLTDVTDIRVGHYTDTVAASGVTVAICSEGAVTGVDVRGSAPGTRETDLLAPSNLVQHAQAVVLSGGSVFGLAAADGVVRWLAKKGLGFPLDKGHVAPIVPAAVLYDLDRGSDFVPPISAEWGEKPARQPPATRSKSAAWEPEQGHGPAVLKAASAAPALSWIPVSPRPLWWLSIRVVQSSIR